MNNPRLTPVRAIKVKYLPSTNHKGSRHKAELIGTHLTLTLPYDYATNDGGKHKAALALLYKAKQTANLEHFGQSELSETFALNNEETIYTLSL
jgi:hypothetical protein